VRGLTLREALVHLSECGVPARASGTGVVVAQRPSAGGRLSPGGTCQLTCRPDAPVRLAAQIEDAQHGEH
jgi:hypothetical protein